MTEISSFAVIRIWERKMIPKMKTIKIPNVPRRMAVSQKLGKMGGERNGYLAFLGEYAILAKLCNARRSPKEGDESRKYWILNTSEERSIARTSFGGDAVVARILLII